MKSFFSLVLFYLLFASQSLYTLYIQSFMSLYLNSQLAISNIFFKRTQSTSVLVIIDRKSEYEILQIVDSKIDQRQTCKLFYIRVVNNRLDFYLFFILDLGKVYDVMLHLSHVGHICHIYKSHSHIIQKRLQEVLKQIILYNIAIVHQPYREYMDFRIGQLWFVHRLWSVLYKIDQFVLETLLSSLVLLNIRAYYMFILSLRHNTL